MNIWLLTDGKMGDLVQCRGIAAHLIAQAGGTVEERTVAPRALWAMLMPFTPIDPREDFNQPGSPIAPNADGEWPDLLIASGRRAVPYLKRVKKLSQGATTTVFLKDPRTGAGTADIIWVPTHDKLRGPNVITSETSPHHITPEALEQARQSGVARFGTHSHTVGVLLGGNTVDVNYNAQTITKLAKGLNDVLNSEGDTDSASRYLITSSRRTPYMLNKTVSSVLSNRECWTWDEEEENPYMQILALSDVLLVTGDSHNMVSEALSTGRPVYVFRPDGLKQKFHNFLEGLEDKGAIRRFDNSLEPFAGTRYDASRNIANTILDFIAKRAH
ncbi:MAG: mitochondrial fission ELM1 family protein [Rhizobiales bacterium]|nr:mitochondrial fission ELM1 family protein [Hyphomicrobiales bacterium]